MNWFGAYVLFGLPLTLVIVCGIGSWYNANVSRAPDHHDTTDH